MSSGLTPGRRAAWIALLALVWPAGACATRGHIATTAELVQLRQAKALSASGRLSLSGARGRASARVVLGMAPPDALRIEIPSGAGLRFVLVTRGGRLRADLPQDNAMFEGAGTAETMKRLFGIDLTPRDLVAALLGSSPASVDVLWRFERGQPAQVTLRAPDGGRLTLTLDDPSTEPLSDQAFAFGPARARSLTVAEMSERLGLVR